MALWILPSSCAFTQQISGKSVLRRNVQLPRHIALEGNELCSVGKRKLLWKSRPNPSFSIPPPVSPLNICKTKQKETEG